MLGLTTIDLERRDLRAVVRLLGPGDTAVATFELAPAGNNAVTQHRFGPRDVGIAGVERLRIEMDGNGTVDASGGIDEILLRLHGAAEGDAP